MEQTKYDPWGEVRAGGVVSKFLYTGQEKDAETGLNYYNFRYYDSHIRRFTQPDDIIQDFYSPQDLNRYSYVRNNPLKYTDPTGHWAAAIRIATIAITIASAPDFQRDSSDLFIDMNDLKEDPSVGKGLGVTVAALSVVAPGASNGGASRIISKHADDAIGATGKYGEKMLNKIVGGGKKFFPVPGFKGGRHVDNYVQSSKSSINEAKTGYVTLTQNIKTQALKDAALVKSNAASEANWYFFQSPVTKKIGPSKPTEKFLKDLGLNPIIYNKTR